MQITSSFASEASDYSNSSVSITAAKPKPESFLTSSDISMLEYVTGTSSLAAAEQDPNAKILADSISTKREAGAITGDYSQYYMPAQLSASDAKMLESTTGTSNIIDAVVSGGGSLDNLALNIGSDRKYGSLTGDLTTSYINDLISFDKEQTAQHAGAGVVISLATLNQALSYLQANMQSTITTQESKSYSVTA